MIGSDGEFEAELAAGLRRLREQIARMAAPLHAHAPPNNVTRWCPPALAALAKQHHQMALNTVL